MTSIISAYFSFSKAILILVFSWSVIHKVEGLVNSRLLNICQGEDYLTPPEGPVTCCSNDTLTPGLSYEKFWNECATPDESEKMVNVTLWRVYSCIVHKHLNSKPLTLENFGIVMTNSYPEDKKKTILDKILENPFTSDENQTETEKLKAIRQKYYDIELDVCTKNASAYRAKMTEYKSYERIYMRSGHCLSSQIPIEPMYYPLASDKDLVATWKTILETVSVNDDQTHGLQIQRACELPSSWVAQEISTSDELFEKPNFQTFLKRITPKWANIKVSETLKTKVDEYWENGFKSLDDASNKTLEEHAIEQSEKYFERNLKKEFVGIRNETKTKSLMVSCLISTFMKTSMKETFSYVICRPQSIKQPSLIQE